MFCPLYTNILAYKSILVFGYPSFFPYSLAYFLVSWLLLLLLGYPARAEKARK